MPNSFPDDQASNDLPTYGPLDLKKQLFIEPARKEPYGGMWTAIHRPSSRSSVSIY
jgi:hypothetical protein